MFLPTAIVDLCNSQSERPNPSSHVPSQHAEPHHATGTRRAHRCDGQPTSGHPACHDRHCPRQAPGNGQRGNGCVGWAAARSKGAGCWPCILARVWRPAGIDCRVGGLGPKCRPGGGLSGQGHQILARVSREHTRHDLEALRHHARRCRQGPAQSPDVQLLPGRYQVIHRDGRHLQCHWAASTT